MDAYTGFSKVYDLFMDNIPYEKWSRYVLGLLEDYGITGGLLLDMGCGTGSLTECLSKAGFDMIGIDHSEEMLQLAMEKRDASGSDILYLLQDMREFELYGTVAAVISICDSINYILESEELVEVFRLVNNYLDPRGIFVFDLNTLYKYEMILGDSTVAETRDEGSFIWENIYDRVECINEYDLTLFIQEEGELYRRYQETHYQRAYTLEEIKQALSQAGLEILNVYDAFTREAPKEDSERVYIVAQESGK